MDVTIGLQQLGFTEYEARAYAALLAAPGSNGYELAKQSGVPRAKIYEAMAGLVAKGAAQVENDGKERTFYHPTAHETLIERYLAQASATAGALKQALAELATPVTEAPLLTVRGYDGLLAHAERIIASARQQILISGQPQEMTQLAPLLKAAEERGVDVYPLTYGQVDLGLRRRFVHGEVSQAHRLAGAVPVLIVVADHREALMAEATASDRATGLLTEQRGVVLIAAEYVKHDIFLCEATRRNGGIIRDKLADLQSMWFTREGTTLED